MRNSKGFTLIELLVVIAIIGLLSSVVLASLSSARKKAKDVVVQSSLIQMRTEATLYYSDNNNYGTAGSYGYMFNNGTPSNLSGACGTERAKVILKEVESNAAYDFAYCIVGVGGKSFISFAYLLTKAPTGNYCVGSNGFGGVLEVSPAFWNPNSEVKCK